MIDLDREIEATASAHDLLHRLWSKAVGTPHYVKAEWKRLEALLRSVDVPEQPPPERKPSKEYLDAMVAEWQRRRPRDATFDMIRWLHDVKVRGAYRVMVFACELSAPHARRSSTPALDIALDEVDGVLLGKINDAGRGSPWIHAIEALSPQCKSVNEPFARFVFQPPGI